MLSSPRVRFALLGVLLAAAITVLLTVGAPSGAAVEAAVNRAGIAAPLVFVLLYATLTVAFFPASVLTGVSGVLFGTALGTVLSVTSATTGATLSFLLARRLGREQIERIAGERIGRLDRWLERRGFLAVLYVRLMPVMPFNALNYASGVTGVRLRDYVLGTAIGIVPGAFAYAALGGSLDDLTSPAFLGAVGLVIVLGLGAPLVDRLVRRRGKGPPRDGA